jgi:hypothetical protein
MMLKNLPEMRRCAEQANPQARTWVETFVTLGEKLGFAIPPQVQSKAA